MLERKREIEKTRDKRQEKSGGIYQNKRETEKKERRGGLSPSFLSDEDRIRVSLVIS